MAHAGHGYTGYDMEHFEDGTGTVEFHHEDGKSHKKFAYADLDDLHDKLEDHLRVVMEDVKELEKAADAQKEEERREEEIHPGIHEEL